jgi:aminoglycoside phosphotransferase (APT) family kinase protein
MTKIDAALPQSLLSWISTTAGGELMSVARHVARREAWNVEIKNAKGEPARYFLRIDRDLAAGRVSTRNLRREAHLIQMLNKAGIPAQKIMGWNDEHCAALQSFEAGVADLKVEDRGVQDKVMRHFMEILGDLHKIDVAGLKLPEFQLPKTPLEHSIMEIEAVEEPNLHPVSVCKTDVLSAFGKRWLINHAPASVERTVLLQGDTGPANFLYDAATGKVTVVVDWEWAHYGDPLEDLGNIWVRDFFCPSSGGDLSPYFRYYAERAGVKLDKKKIEYYRIHQLVRGVQGLARVLGHLNWQETVALNLGYRAFLNMHTCRAMRAFAGETLPHNPAPPLTTVEEENTLQTVMARQLEAFVIPNVAEPYGKFMAGGLVDLARHLDLQARYGSEVDDRERAGLSKLLNKPVTDLAAGRRELIPMIESLKKEDEAPVLAHLSMMVELQAVLMAPLIAPFSAARWAKVDV